eukprot:783851_1
MCISMEKKQRSNASRSPATSPHNGGVSVPFTPINSNWSHVYLPNAIPIHSQYIPSQDTNECMIDENEPYHFKVLLCVAVRTTWRTVHSLQIIDPYTLPLVTIHTQLESADFSVQKECLIQTKHGCVAARFVWSGISKTDYGYGPGYIVQICTFAAAKMASLCLVCSYVYITQ